MIQIIFKISSIFILVFLLENCNPSLVQEEVQCPFEPIVSVISTEVQEENYAKISTQLESKVNVLKKSLISGEINPASVIEIKK